LENIIAQLRHAYSQLASGSVSNQKNFADGLIAPQIERLEELAAAGQSSKGVPPTILEIIENASAGAYGPDSMIIGKMAGLIQASQFDGKLGGPFICGTVGAENPDGLHDGYLICPAFGADVSCTTAYFKDDRSSKQAG